MLSRVADSLYWMSRYLERAEHTARVLGVNLNLSLEQSRLTTPRERWERTLKSLHVPIPEEGISDAYSATALLAFETDNLNTIGACIANSRENARHVREKISTEMWLQLNRLYLEMRESDMDTIWNAQPQDFLQAIKEAAHLFQGITDATVLHDEGWQFIQLGRSIERAMSVATLLDTQLIAFPMLDDHEIEGDVYFEWLGLLKACTAFEAYCKVYNADLRPRRILEFLLFNAEFPHSVRFCVEHIGVALLAVAESTGSSKNQRVHRLAGRLRSELSFDTVDDLAAHGTHVYLENLQQQCIQIHDSLYETYVTYPIEAVL